MLRGARLFGPDLTQNRGRHEEGNAWFRGARHRRGIGDRSRGGRTGRPPDDGNCWSGYACGYEHPDFTGRAYGTAKSTTRWAEAGFANIATGASANGARCKATRFYKSWNYTTNNVYGDYFTLQSQQLVGSNWKDGDLRNDAGGTSGDWNDTVEASRFVLC